MYKVNLRKEYKQVGKRKSLHLDRLFKAKKSGWRKSRKHYYFENRRNRSDVIGKRI
jgi:hypothetical protein